MSFFLAFISEKSNFDVVFYLKFYTWLFYLIIIFFLPFQYIRRLQVKTHLSLFDYKLYGIYIATVNTLRFKLLYYSLHIIVGQTSIIMAFKTIYISIKKFNVVFFQLPYPFKCEILLLISKYKNFQVIHILTFYVDAYWQYVFWIYNL